MGSDVQVHHQAAITAITDTKEQKASPATRGLLHQFNTQDNKQGGMESQSPESLSLAPSLTPTSHQWSFQGLCGYGGQS